MQLHYSTKTFTASKKKIRYVWLKNSLYTNMTFARSTWHIINHKNFKYKISQHHPVGISFIRNKVDIHRKIYEIYYCYYYRVEHVNKLNEIVWGRKYIIHSFKNYNAIIQEFFSPEIII